jgi:hypothetical protein
MLTSYNLLNNVRTTLNDAIDADDTSILINQASSPYKDPPTPGANSLGQSSVLTIVDSLTTPTKIEIITYSGLTDNGDGTLTISGVTRGAESTVASAFSSGAYVYQALTAGCFEGPVADINSNEGVVNFAGFAADTPGVVSSNANGFRTIYNGGIQMIADCATSEHGPGQRLGGFGCLGDDLAIVLPPSGDPSVDTRYPLRVTNNTGYSSGEAIVVMKNADINRIELLKAARLWPANTTSFVTSTTIDWKENDIKRMNLTASAASVVMTDTSDYLIPGGAYRRLTLLVYLPDVTNPGYTVAWPANVIHAGGAPPDFTTGQDCIYRIEILFDGSVYLMSEPEFYQL